MLSPIFGLPLPAPFLTRFCLPSGTELFLSRFLRDCRSGESSMIIISVLDDDDDDEVTADCLEEDTEVDEATTSGSLGREDTDGGSA